MPLVIVDDYLIRKGYGIFNIFDFINSMLGANSVEEGMAALQESHHDLNHNEYSGVEADAVKMAIQAHDGTLTEQEIAIIQAGESANPQAWRAAFQKAINTQAPAINEAIKRTNEMTGDVLPQAFQLDLGNYVATQAWKTPVLGYKQKGNNTPTKNSQGAVITQYVSKLTGKPESYARPYHVGLTAMRKETNPYSKAVARDTISPRILHADTINLKDDKLKSKFGLAVQSVKLENPGVPPEQLMELAMQRLKSLPEFQMFGGIAHAPIEAGKFSPQNIQQNRVMAETEENNRLALANDNLLHLIHPDMRDHATFTTQGNKAYHSEVPSNKMMKLWQQHHGWDEETTRRVYADAYSGKYQGTAKNKLLQAVQTQEMLDGKPPSWAGEAYRLPSGDGYDYGVKGPDTPPQPELPTGSPPINTEQPKPPVDVPPPATPPLQQVSPELKPYNIPPLEELARRQTSPPIPIRPDPLPPRQNNAMMGASPTPQKPPSNAPPMLNTYPRQPTPTQSKERGFLDNLLYNLGYGYAQLFPSFRKSEGMSDVEMIQNMLENVQLEIAKQELTYFKKSNYSITSINDVNEIGKNLKRPSSDVVSIYHTRGDWDNIAKTHGLTKKEVQLVKVAFNE